MDANGERTLIAEIIFATGGLVGLLAGLLAGSALTDHAWKSSAVKANAGGYVSSPSGNLTWVWNQEKGAN